MKKNLPIFLGLLSVLVISGCSKKDIQNYKNKCDYVEALSSSLDNGGPNTRSLFKKEYQPGTNQLVSVSYNFLSLAGVGYNLKTANVEYKGNSMIFRVANSPDTAALLNFNQAGRLVDASSVPFMFDFQSSKYLFRFYYTPSGKLREAQIKQVRFPGNFENPLTKDWQPWVTITYDAKEENVLKIDYSIFNRVSVKSAYVYDYSRKIKNQVYPDENLVNSWDFWTFLKYLNVFPELMPKHVLLESTTAIDYPGTQKRAYRDQVVDAAGNLTSYKVDVGFLGNSTIEQVWQVRWQCGNNYVPKSME